MMREKIKATTILSLSMLTILTSQAIAPILGEIQAEFRDIPDFGIRMIVLLPPLCIMAVNIIMPFLVERYEQKRILMTGLICYVIGGLGGGLCREYWQLLTIRIVLGIGCGMVMPFAQTLLTEFFQGKIYVYLTGLTSAMTFFSGIFASLFIAVIPAGKWKYSFFIYGIGIIIAIAAYFFIPDIKRQKDIPKSGKIQGKSWMIVAEMCMANMAFYGLTTNLTMFLKEQGIESKVFASSVNIVFMLTGFFIGTMYARIRRYAGNTTMIWGYFFMGAGYLLLWITQSPYFLLIGAGIVGGSYSLVYPSIYLYGKAGSRGKENCGKVVSMLIIATFGGQFLSGIFMKFLWKAGVIYRYQQEFLAWCLLLLCLCFIEYWRKRYYPIEVEK
ncbi:MFS transporter [Ruminococcus sp. AF18-22]|jgi:MFS family permease|nr:MFS transporter [Ruminococcus sp. AF18-22]